MVASMGGRCLVQMGTGSIWRLVGSVQGLGWSDNFSDSYGRSDEWAESPHDHNSEWIDHIQDRNIDSSPESGWVDFDQDQTNDTQVRALTDGNWTTIDAIPRSLAQAEIQLCTRASCQANIDIGCDSITRFIASVRSVSIARIFPGIIWNDPGSS